nr:hypothetical protein CFP56_22954 [Quercus suber]
MKENGGCLHRICGSPGDVFYAVCGSSTGNVAVGGADRTVTIFDPRRWSALSRWVHCSKYEGSTTGGGAMKGKAAAARSMEEWRRLSRVLASEWVGFLSGGGRG